MVENAHSEICLYTECHMIIITEPISKYYIPAKCAHPMLCSSSHNFTDNLIVGVSTRTSCPSAVSFTDIL